jgi:Ni/Co efflux regulator RcnB
MQRLLSISLAAALALTAIGGTAASAQPYQPGPPPGYGHPHGPPGYDHPYGPPGYGWHRGDHYHGDRYVVRDYGRYHLRYPPPGYEWVQNGGQFVLIAVASGVIADIILNSQYH